MKLTFCSDVFFSTLSHHRTSLDCRTQPKELSKQCSWQIGHRISHCWGDEGRFLVVQRGCNGPQKTAWSSRLQNKNIANKWYSCVCKLSNLIFVLGWGWDCKSGHMNADRKLQGRLELCKLLQLLHREWSSSVKLLERKVTWKHTQGECDPWAYGTKVEMPGTSVTVYVHKVSKQREQLKAAVIWVYLKTWHFKIHT